MCGGVTEGRKQEDKIIIREFFSFFFLFFLSERRSGGLMEETLEREVQEHQWKERGHENSLEGDGSREIDQNEQSQGERSNHGCSACGKREF